MLAQPVAITYSKVPILAITKATSIEPAVVVTLLKWHSREVSILTLLFSFGIDWEAMGYALPG